MITKILTPFIPVIYEYGYAAVIFCTIMEGASIPFPGSPVLIVIGFLIYQGSVNIWTATFLGAFFYALAAVIPYYIGKNLKESLFDFLVRTFKVPRKRIVSVEQFFYKHGEASVCIARPFFIGNYISYLAGMANIHLLKFFVLTYFGILPWVGAYLWLGYFFRGNLYRAIGFLEKHNIPEISIGILLLLLLGLFIFRRRTLKKRRN